jgi:hypothetical protein
VTLKQLKTHVRKLREAATRRATRNRFLETRLRAGGLARAYQNVLELLEILDTERNR